jgi:hypothetical protein
VFENVLTQRTDFVRDDSGAQLDHDLAHGDSL